MLPLIMLSSLYCCAQNQYYHFYYTNLPADRIEAYGTAFRAAFDRIYLPGYSDTCHSCAPLAADAPFQAEALPALRQALLQYIPGEVYHKNEVPGSYYHLVGNKNLPYIIRTLYIIDGDKAEPLYQVKVTFTNDPTPSVYNMEVFSPKEGKRFSRKLVLANYKQMAKSPAPSRWPPLAQH
ncbi:hypothetical protein EPD60_03810 [Flaviaesturariibacter flavus]|uniref:Uncharacterized protein n=1 Tax=Flaviaesturariibacter flavus TaxID=2502780 RepID=A0A4R1BMJ6_9BACT|nr:hypothetical protein [Flaviaesturariibacter flavus]TCJ18635.1 hypothetical protein EPD60_03810 [Flaviaesturariibacter flavus]